MKNRENIPGEILKTLPRNYSCKAAATLEDQMKLNWCNHSVKLMSTPDHTQGSCCIEFDEKYIFTGDSLIKNTAIITKIPTGNVQEYNTVTLPYLNSIAPNYQVMPGHGESSLMNEVKKTNKF